MSETTLLERSEPEATSAHIGSSSTKSSRRALLLPDGRKCPALKTDLHTWSFNLDVADDELTRFEAYLEPAELAKAKRFRFEVHRKRFIAGRGWLRELLGYYIKRDPAAVRFSYGSAGKPTLAEREPRVHFNLAHSADLAVCALACNGPVGVDCERVRPLDDAADLVDRFFSPRESFQFSQLPEALRPEAFFNLWTRKEALLKATGEGIAHSLHRVEVSFLPGEPGRLLAAPLTIIAGRWSLIDLPIAPGVAAALAVAVVPRQVSHWEWPRAET